MRKIIMVAMIGLAMSCNNAARDGDAGTDTSNLPRDTNRGKTTTDHINTADGTRMLDTNQKTKDSIR